MIYFFVAGEKLETFSVPEKIPLAGHSDYRRFVKLKLVGMQRLQNNSKNIKFMTLYNSEMCRGSTFNPINVLWIWVCLVVVFDEVYWSFWAFKGLLQDALALLLFALFCCLVQVYSDLYSSPAICVPLELYAYILLLWFCYLCCFSEDVWRSFQNHHRASAHYWFCRTWVISHWLLV